jgi:molybdate transport system substrate-binding protein
VPAGMYAKAALQSLGIWDSVRGRIAAVENVRVALLLVARAEAPLGIVYATDAREEPRVRVVGTFADSLHPPIVYPVALVKGAPAAAADVLAFLHRERARHAFAAHGFTPLN